MIAILAGVGKVLEAGMRGGVSDELRLGGLGDKADEPFVEPHAHLAHALRLETDGGREHQIGALEVEHVERTDLGVEPASNQIDDIQQRFFGIATLRDDATDLLERPQ